METDFIKPAAAAIILIVCGLCAGCIHARETTTVDSVKQKEELTGYLSEVEKKLADRQQIWLAAQKAKAQYDTIGLAQYRYEMKLLKTEKREAWIKAIHKDNLTWQHVSSLKYWNDPVAKLYSVRSIPQNFLIDPRGKIIAANLRGEELFQELEKLLK
jgi:hypothetical protein